MVVVNSRGSWRSLSSCLVLAVAAALSVACGGSKEEATVPDAPSEAPPPANPEPAAKADTATDPESVALRLNKEFDHAARNGTATEEAQAFIREHETELTRIYVDDYDALSKKTRVTLINLLVSFQSQATAPAHAAAISRYAEGTGNVDEAIWACQAAKKLKSPELAAALMTAFNAIDMAEDDGLRFSRHLADAMETNVVASWAPALEKHRDATIAALDTSEDKARVRTYRNQKYWQETSVRLLDRLKAGEQR